MMNWFRKSLVAFSAFLLFIVMLNLAWSVSFNQNFANPDKVKAWLVESKLYDNAVKTILEYSQNEQDKKGTSDSSLTLKDQLIQQAAIESFSPQLLKDTTNTFIDSNYAWLTGKTAAPDYKIDLTQAKEEFATKVGTAVETRLAGLTVCTAEQQAQLQIPISVTTVTCRPANLDPKTEGERIANEIRNDEFLANPVITADTFAHDTTNTASKPYYKELSAAPQIYQVMKFAPYILSLIALILVMIIIFLIPERRRGWRRVASVLFFAGILLVVSKFAYDYGAKKLDTELSKSTTIVNQLQQPRKDFISYIEQDLTKTNLYFGIGYIVVAVLIYSGVIFTRNSGNNKNKNKATATGASTNKTPENKPKTPTNRTPSTDISGNSQTPTGPPVFKTPKPTPVRKNPKPPRLIQ